MKIKGSVSLPKGLRKLGVVVLGCLLVSVPAAAGNPYERELNPFMGEPEFDKKNLFKGQRMPNVVVTTEGTVLAVWGDVRHVGEDDTVDSDSPANNMLVRRSEDGGATWGPPIGFGPGRHGGGVTVDEGSGKIIAFVEERAREDDEYEHPKEIIDRGFRRYPTLAYKSADDGKSWTRLDLQVEPHESGIGPLMHIAEKGITLRHGEHPGRLLRPARLDGEPFLDGRQNVAIYSDDGGRNWKLSELFPKGSTLEGALVELSDGTIYYNSRRHGSPRMRWEAWSEDSGVGWSEPQVSGILPDGPRNSDYGCMGGLERLPIQGRDILIFSNIDSDSGRRRGTVWVSFDGGETWPVKRLVEEGSFSYSSLAAGRPGTPSEGWIYLFYESADGGDLARFNLSWVVEGEETGDGRKPEWVESVSLR